MGNYKNEAAVRFGRELNRLRRLSGYTQERLAKEVGGFSSSHISNIERGETAPDLRLVRDFDRALGADGRLDRLWGQLTSSGEPVWLGALAELEAEAVSIMESQPVFVPSLLQTEDYAHAVIKATTPGRTKAEVTESVNTRMKRAQRFIESETPAYRAVLDRMVIERGWSNAGVMAEQLSRIVEQIECDRAVVQVVHLQGGHPGLRGPFKLITSLAAPDVVYTEAVDSGQVTDDAKRVGQFRLLYNDIQALALSPEQSLIFIKEELEKLNDG